MRKINAYFFLLFYKSFDTWYTFYGDLMHSKVSEFIYNLRKKYKLTQQDLAQKLGVTYQAVSKWENEKSIPDIEVLQLISKEFNVDITEILEGKKPKKMKWLNYAIPIVCAILLIVGFAFFKKSDSFEFKTLISDTNNFSIDGVIAYSKDKSSIYISKIQMEEEGKEEYRIVECALYEANKEISRCENSSKELTTLKTLLQDVTFYINDLNCNNLSHENLYLIVNALNENQEEVSYKVPLKFADYCG